MADLGGHQPAYQCMLNVHCFTYHIILLLNYLFAYKAQNKHEHASEWQAQKGREVLQLFRAPGMHELKFYSRDVIKRPPK